MGPLTGPAGRPRVALVGLVEERRRLCRDILEALPAWFARPRSREAYIREAARHPMLACRDGSGDALGILVLKPQTASAIEIAVMGVRPTHHRRGTGRALVGAAARLARKEGAVYLTVKTLAASHPDEHYAATRAFYDSVGFLPLEVFPTLWGKATPCLLMVKHLARARL